MAGNRRPTLPEGGAAVSLSTIGETVGLPAGSVRSLLTETSGRLRRQLRLRDEPFTLSNESVFANGIAGVIRLAPGVEVEIVPKCFNAESPDWHGDFLLMAAVTRLGRIFQSEQVAASLHAEHKDVLTLLAAVFLKDLERLSRVPIREYQRSSWIDSTLDGELDYAEVWAVRPEGFLQTGPILSVDNQFMGVIGAAASYLADASSDRGIGHRLHRLAAVFPNIVRGRTREKVPGRYARWQDLYALAIAVRAGLGLQPVPNGELRAPGFILNTERGWEDLLALALATQGGELGAKVKPASRLGTRLPGMQDVLTYPDLVLSPPSLKETVVVDAKYKGTSARRVERIAATDLYEALAFLTAQRSSVAILVYPGGGLSSTKVEPGTLVPFDEVLIGSHRIIGASVSTGGVGRTRGLTEFGRRLGQSLLEAATRC